MRAVRDYCGGVAGVPEVDTSGGFALSFSKVTPILNHHTATFGASPPHYTMVDGRNHVVPVFNATEGVGAG